MKTVGNHEFLKHLLEKKKNYSCERRFQLKWRWELDQTAELKRQGSVEYGVLKDLCRRRGYTRGALLDFVKIAIMNFPLDIRK